MQMKMFWRVLCMHTVCMGLFFSVQGVIVPPILSSSMSDVTVHEEISNWNLKSDSFSSSPLDTITIKTSFSPSYLDLNDHLTASFSDLPSQFSETSYSTTSETFSTVSVPSSESTYYLNIENHESKISNLGSSSNTVSLTGNETTQTASEVSNIEVEAQNTFQIEETPSLGFVSQSVIKSSSLRHFHTPLMSLLVASSSMPFPQHEESQSHFLPYASLPSHSMTTLYNETSNADVTPPTEMEHKKLLMLVLRAEDCSRLSKADFEKMLGKLMTKFGFGDAVPEVSNAKCFSHLHINLTVSGETPTLQFLPNLSDKHNVTVDVLNRTFRVVKLEKIDLKFEKSKSSNSSSAIITSVAEHESVAYVSVGVTFGLVLVLCITMCCIKCLCLQKSQKRLTTITKNAHVRLRPEDYTLTPITRPTSLYVDYYRGSAIADIYSTTSAGSIASTTPTVDQGIIQPFDTSIVPLEDSSALPLSSSRDPSVESVPAQSDLKTFNIQGLAGKGLRNIPTDSKEQLNPRQNPQKVGSKTSGVTNPTFQRY